MTALEQTLGTLVGRLQEDLVEALPPEVLAKVCLYLAASELLIDQCQPADAGRLRMASAHLVLETLGVSDSSVERAKVMLASGRDPDSLNWRN